MEIKCNPMLRRSKPIETQVKFRNENKYYKYHEDYRHTTTECYELKKALREFANQGQFNRFLRRGRGGDRNRSNPEGKKDNEANHNMETVSTIITGIDDKEWNTGYRKAQIQKLSQVMATRELKPLKVPTMTFGPEDKHPLQTPHNDALVIHLKITTAMYTEKGLEAVKTPVVGSGE
ncbi:hypothetical protein Cgig2_009683 [Carnegiea gigantea]|uniref:Reverse transcriptase domain-containing protein n=1 Tax=Carnegiea gigantea TaxID=171969 RepID=A0A9Q1K6M1_9CARY|nr:hypothetical protein Cgig2_009683 [Carnegiea gigantea]